MDENISTKKLLVRVLLRFLLVILVLVVCLVFGRTLLGFFLPFLLAYFISAVILMPIIRRLSGKFDHFRRLWSVVFVIFIMAIAILLLFGLVFYIVEQATDIIRNWESYQENFQVLAKNVSKFVSERTNLEYRQVLDYIYAAGDRIMRWVNSELPGMAPTVMNGITDYAPMVGNFLLAFLFFLLATYFICADFPIIREKLKGSISEGIRPHIEQIKEAAGSATFGYLRAQLIVSSLVALIALVVFLIIGQNYAAVFAIIIGFVDFIPLLGSSVILVPWIVILVIAGSYTKAIVFAILAFGLFLFRRIVEPKIVGNQTGLHPLVSLISLYIGIKVGGIIGMIAAPIVCMIFISLYKVGFFKPTISDIKVLIKRAADYAEMK